MDTLSEERIYQANLVREREYEYAQVSDDAYYCMKCGEFVPNIFQAPECSLDSGLCIQCWNQSEEREYNE